MALNLDKLGSIFQSRPDIINGIKSAAGKLTKRRRDSMLF